ncbi:MAG: CcmD family protein [Chitinophagaceae bacterium]
MKKILGLIAGSIAGLPSWTVWAQQPVATAADAGIQSNGKIGVVMVICLTILAGLFVYLFNLDRKIDRLEKK